MQNYEGKTSSSMFSRVRSVVTFGAISAVFDQQAHRTLSVADLPSASANEVNRNLEQALITWDELGRRGGFYRWWYALNKGRFALATVLMLLAVGMGVYMPLLVKTLIEKITAGTSVADILPLAGLFIVVAVGASLFDAHAKMQRAVIELTTLAGLSGLLARQALESGEATDEGILAVLATDDAATVSRLGDLVHDALALIELALGVSILFTMVDVAGGIALTMAVVAIATGRIVSKKLHQNHKVVAEATSRRASILSEMFRSIQTIKLGGYEPAFEKKVLSERIKEAKAARHNANLITFANLVVNFASELVPLSVLLATSLLGTTLSPGLVVGVMLLTTRIQNAMAVLPKLTGNYAQLSAAVERVTEYLKKGVRLRSGRPQAHSRVGALSLKNATYAWDGSRPALFDVNLEVEPGTFVVVVGKVGSGKTTLAHALLGQVPLLSGQASVGGRLAWVPQTTWISGETIADAIVFGRNQNEASLKRAVRESALERDIDALPEGLARPLNDRSDNLSGGQRQRVAIARALYSQADIYLFDSPTSALDGETARTVNRALKSGKSVSGSTRILFTSNPLDATEADLVVVLDEGRIVEKGTFLELTGRAGVFRDIYHHALKAEAGKATVAEITSSKSLGQRSNRVQSLSATLPGDEQANTSQKVLRETIRRYIANALPGRAVIGYILLLLGVQAVAIANEYWLMRLDRFGSNILTLGAPIALLLAVVSAVFAGLRIRCVLRAAVRGGQIEFARMLRGVLAVAPSFFARNSAGSLMSRFARDVQVIDRSLALSMHSLAVQVVQVVFSLSVIAVASPVALLIAVPFVLIARRWHKLYSNGRQAAKEIELEARGPVLSTLEQSVHGREVLDAYGAKAKQLGLFSTTLERQVTASKFALMIDYWLAVRLDLISAFLFAMVTVSIALMKGAFDPGIAALALYYVIEIPERLRSLAIQTGDTRAACLSLSRVNAWQTLPPESVGEQKSEVVPSRGLSVSADRIDVRYGSEAPILRDLSLVVAAGERIGIVGRSGSGKSTLAGAIVRWIPCEDDSRLALGGKAVTEWDAAVFRQRVAYLPQFPVIFRETLRFNIDPMERFSDEDIQDTLRRCSLGDWFAALPSGLNSDLGESGTVVSGGQTQLVSLARLMINRPSLAILDEPTSQADQETSATIRRIIKEELEGITVIVISHRADILADMDRSIHMEGGHIVHEDLGSPRLYE